MNGQEDEPTQWSERGSLCGEGAGKEEVSDCSDEGWGTKVSGGGRNFGETFWRWFYQAEMLTQTGLAAIQSRGPWWIVPCLPKRD
jgi:hypothetical protein